MMTMRLNLPLTLLLLAAASTASATVANVSADAHVTSALPSTNFGTRSNLAVNSTSTAYVRFDLTNLPSGTTSAQVSKATMYVYVNRVNTSGTISLASLSSSFNELAVTYSNKPAANAVGVTSASISAAGTYVPLDVTALVQGWVTTPASNYGVALSASAADVLLDSKENDLTGHAAFVDVTLASQGATGATGANGTNGANGANGTNGAAGATGATGATGGTGATGATGITYLGTWISGTAYTPSQTVTYSGSTYYNIVATNGTAAPSTDTSHWTLIAAAGTNGTAGATGATGTNGTNGSVGAVGPTGATGPTAGGTFVLGTTYPAGSVVTYNGISYLSLASNVNVTPPLNATDWTAISAGSATYTASSFIAAGQLVTFSGTSVAPITTSQTTGILGITSTANGSGNPVSVQLSGITNCSFDATAITAGHYVIASTVTAGDCHDAGATYPTSGQVLGVALATASGSTLASVYLQGPEVRGGGSGGTTLSAGTAAGQVYLTGASGAVPTTPVSVQGDATLGSNGALTITASAAAGHDIVSAINSGNSVVAVSNVGSGSGSSYNFLNGLGVFSAPVTLTTTGTSGAATFNGNTLNIPTPSGGSPNSLDWNGLFNNGNYTSTALYYAPNSTVSNGGATSIQFSSSNEAVVPTTCTVSSFSVGILTTTAGSGSDSPTLTLYHNGAQTSMACTATGVSGVSGSKGSCSTTSNTFNVVPGDTLSIRLAETNAAPVFEYATLLKCQ